MLFENKIVCCSNKGGYALRACSHTIPKDRSRVRKNEGE